MKRLGGDLTEAEFEGIVQAAVARIERGWCQGAIARTAGGAECGAWSPKAASWCLMGAVDAAAMEVTGCEGDVDQVFRRLQDGGGVDEGLAAWNDAEGRTADEVLKRLKEVL